MSKNDRAAFSAALQASVSAIGALRAEIGKAQETSRSVMVRLAVALWNGGEALSALKPEASVIDWAVAQASGFGTDGGEISPPTAYRLRHAGCVATALGTKLDGRDVNYTSLVPLYRVIAAAKDEATQAAAVKLVGTLWAQAVRGAGRKGRPTEEAVKQLVEAKQPSGTRGKQGKSAAGRKVAKDATRATSAAKAAAKNEPTKGNGETVSVEIDSAALESAIGVVDSQLTQWNGSNPSRVTVMVATLRLAEEHGIGTIEAALHSLMRQAAAKAKQPKPKPEEAAPKAAPKAAAPKAARRTKAAA